MDNLTSNQTNYSSASTMLDVPGFIAFNVLMLVGFVLPAAILDTSILIAFAVDKVTPGVIRFILANFLLVGLVMLFLLTLDHLTALVLVTTDHSPPPLDFCSVILWALFGAGALRLTLTATFSVVVLIIIWKGIVAINRIVLAMSIVILWMACFFSFNLGLLVLPSNNDYIDGVACLPVGDQNFIDELFAGMYVLVFGVIPLLISIAVPITIFVYLFRHKMPESSSAPFMKAMAKLSALLILGGLINFVGQVSPAIISVVAFSLPNKPVPGVVVFYVSLILLNLSLWPTPILILVYVKSLRKSAMKILLFCIRCYHYDADHPPRTPRNTLQTE